MNVVHYGRPATVSEVHLAPGDVHVWSLSLDDPPRPLPELLADLTAGERARAARYRMARVRDRFTVGRACLRRVLSRYLGMTPASVPIGYAGSGKPVLDGTELHFNVSHTEGVGLIAVAGSRVGVDVERAREVPHADGLVERFFSASEREAYGGLERGERQAAFFRGWTCKEAVIKAVGASIESLDAFDVELRPDRPPAVLAARHAAIGACGWSLHSWEPAPGYASALALQHGPMSG